MTRGREMRPPSARVGIFRERVELPIAREASGCESPSGLAAWHGAPRHRGTTGSTEGGK